MRLNEFIAKYSEELLAYYMPRAIFEKEIGSLGWNSGKIIYLNEFDEKADKDIVCVDANLYVEGMIIGIAPKSYIKADGETSFIINGTTYDHVITAIEAEGMDIMYNINNWEWLIEKEWMINRTKDDYNISIFSEFENCPERTTIGG